MCMFRAFVMLSFYFAAAAAAAAAPFYLQFHIDMKYFTLECRGLHLLRFQDVLNLNACQNSK
jgi:hypothetical protein